MASFCIVCMTFLHVFVLYGDHSDFCLSILLAKSMPNVIVGTASTLLMTRRDVQTCFPGEHSKTPTRLGNLTFASFVLNLFPVSTTVSSWSVFCIILYAALCLQPEECVFAYNLIFHIPNPNPNLNRNRNQSCDCLVAGYWY